MQVRVEISEIVGLGVRFVVPVDIQKRCWEIAGEDCEFRVEARFRIVSSRLMVRGIGFTVMMDVHEASRLVRVLDLEFRVWSLEFGVRC